VVRFWNLIDSQSEEAKRALLESFQSKAAKSGTGGPAQQQAIEGGVSVTQNMLISSTAVNHNGH